jgi:hypothetical protein
MKTLLFTVSALLRAPEAIVSTMEEEKNIIKSDEEAPAAAGGTAGPDKKDISCCMDPCLGASMIGTSMSTSSSPRFLLAYMRSGSVPLEELFEEAARHDLAPAILEDFTW